MDLSIVIPVWNERQKIARDIRQAAGFLIRQNLSGEILIVDDGSEDGTAGAARSVKIPGSVRLDVIVNPDHRGKGFAVRTGMLRAQGNVVLFIDSGSCVPYEDIRSGLELVRSGHCDLAHGSRYLPQSRIRHAQIRMRRISSFLFRHFVRFCLHVPGHLTDTQCGLKLYPREAAHRLYTACHTDGFMFDIEIILIARSMDLRICEFPIHWTSDPDSRLSLSRALFPVVKELRTIKKRFSS